MRRIGRGSGMLLAVVIAASSMAFTPHLSFASTPPGSGSSNCSFMMATESLPTLQGRVEAAFADAGLTVKRVTAFANGESGRCGQESVSTFRAMYSVVGITVPVTDLSDRDAMGNSAAAMADALLPVLATATPDVMPGPNSTSIRINFEMNNGQYAYLDTTQRALQTKRSEGLTGDGLLTSLGFRS